MGSFAALDSKASTSGDAELSASQKEALAKIKDPKKRERIKQKMLEAKRAEGAASAAAKDDKPKDDQKPSSKRKEAGDKSDPTVNVHPAQQSVDVKAPAINLNLPAPHVNVNHGNLSWSHMAARTSIWAQAFCLGAAAWALVGDGVLRLFGH